MFSMFYEQAKLHPDAICISNPVSGENFSFSEAFNRVLQISTLLSREGISQGTRVALMLNNSSEWICIFLALSRLEAVPVPVNTQYKSLALRHILSDSGAAAVIYDACFAEPVLSALEVLEQCRIRIELGGTAGSGLVPDPDTALFGGPFNPKGDDEAIVYYSAGTLGPPKGAVYSNRRFLRNVVAVQEYLKCSNDDALYIGYPLYHYVAQIAGMGAMLRSGSRIIPGKSLSSEPDPSLLNGCTALVDLPETVSLMSHEDAPLLPSDLKYIVTGGYPLDRSILKDYHDKQTVPVFQAYGMVEAGPILTFNSDMQKADSIGIPVDGFSVAVMEDGRILQPGRSGNISISGHLMVESCVGRVQADAEKARDGWFYSSDMGYGDIDGYLYFQDRKINRILVNGFDVYPEEIESKLKKMDGIEDAAVIGNGNSGALGHIEAFVVTEHPGHPDSRSIEAFLRDRLPRYQMPGEIIHVNHLPKNLAGKVSRQSLRKNTVAKTAVKLEE